MTPFLLFYILLNEVSGQGSKATGEEESDSMASVTDDESIYDESDIHENPPIKQEGESTEQSSEDIENLDPEPQKERREKRTPPSKNNLTDGNDYFEKYLKIGMQDIQNFGKNGKQIPHVPGWTDKKLDTNCELGFDNDGNLILMREYDTNVIFPPKCGQKDISICEGICRDLEKVSQEPKIKIICTDGKWEFAFGYNFCARWSQSYVKRGKCDKNKESTSKIRLAMQREKRCFFMGRHLDNASAIEFRNNRCTIYHDLAIPLESINEENDDDAKCLVRFTSPAQLNVRDKQMKKSRKYYRETESRPNSSRKRPNNDEDDNSGSEEDSSESKFIAQNDDIRMRPVANEDCMEVGSIERNNYKITGTLFTCGSKILQLRNFSYNSKDQDVIFVVGGTQGVEPGESGIPIPYHVRRRYFDDEITLPLPSGVTVSTIKWFAIWSEKYKKHFIKILLRGDWGKWIPGRCIDKKGTVLKGLLDQDYQFEKRVEDNTECWNFCGSRSEYQACEFMKKFDSNEGVCTIFMKVPQDKVLIGSADGKKDYWCMINRVNNDHENSDGRGGGNDGYMKVHESNPDWRFWRQGDCMIKKGKNPNQDSIVMSDLGKWSCGKYCRQKENSTGCQYDFKKQECTIFFEQLSKENGTKKLFECMIGNTNNKQTDTSGKKNSSREKKRKGDDRDDQKVTKVDEKTNVKASEHIPGCSANAVHDALPVIQDGLYLGFGPWEKGACGNFTTNDQDVYHDLGEVTCELDCLAKCKADTSHIDKIGCEYEIKDNSGSCRLLTSQLDFIDKEVIEKAPEGTVHLCSRVGGPNSYPYTKDGKKIKPNPYLYKWLEERNNNVTNLAAGDAPWEDKWKDGPCYNRQEVPQHLGYVILPSKNITDCFAQCKIYKNVATGCQFTKKPRTCIIHTYSVVNPGTDHVDLEEEGNTQCRRRWGWSRKIIGKGCMDNDKKIRQKLGISIITDVEKEDLCLKEHCMQHDSPTGCEYNRKNQECIIHTFNITRPEKDTQQNRICWIHFNGQVSENDIRNGNSKGSSQFVEGGSDFNPQSRACKLLSWFFIYAL